MTEMPKDLNEAPADAVKEFLNSFDTIFTDCDGNEMTGLVDFSPTYSGVLWLENELIENSDTALNKMREIGKKVFYITNNSTKKREEFLEKCGKLGFIANWNEIINTSYLAAEYLSGIKFDKKVYIIGSSGIEKELDRFGIKHTECGPDVLDDDLETYMAKRMRLDPEVGAVLIGFDQHFSFPKMLLATNYLKNPDCLFIATGTDENIVVNGLTIPGTGCLVKCIETACGRQAYVVGKPNDYIKEAVTKNCDINPERTLMIGDRCNTDILFGKRCGFKTLLVLSGVTSREDVTRLALSGDARDRDLVPQYFVNKLGDLLQFVS